MIMLLWIQFGLLLTVWGLWWYFGWWKLQSLKEGDLMWDAFGCNLGSYPCSPRGSKYLLRGKVSW